MLPESEVSRLTVISFLHDQSKKGLSFCMKVQVSHNCHLSTIHEVAKWTERPLSRTLKGNSMPLSISFDATKESV